MGACRLPQISSRSRPGLETQALLREAVLFLPGVAAGGPDFDGPVRRGATTSQGEQPLALSSRAIFGASKPRRGIAPSLGLASSTPDRAEGAGSRRRCSASESPASELQAHKRRIRLQDGSIRATESSRAVETSSPPFADPPTPRRRIKRRKLRNAVSTTCPGSS